MSKKAYKTPGVYIKEVSGFPASVVGVPTSIPAFIGYTAQAELNGKDCAFVPIKITSFLEFQSIFCFPDGSDPVQQYSPQYYLVEQNSMPSTGDFLLIGANYYFILPDAHTIYYMYNSVKLFYQNGGEEANIVSVGGYGKASGTHLNLGESLVNPNVRLADFLAGLETLKTEEEPTMYVCPEATLLSIPENGTLMQQMLHQNSQMKKSISIFDIIGGNRKNPLGYEVDIEEFRNHTGNTGLAFGAAYYPFVGTSIMGMQDLNFSNLFGGDVSALAIVFSSLRLPEKETLQILQSIYNSQDLESVNESHRKLLALSATYKAIISAVLEIANILPASGGMAGVITNNDNQRGVWKAPANVSMNGVNTLTIHIDNMEQQNLNINVCGKSINAIRSFPGKGILVWGARTLAGNDNEWRYINVRRTMIFIEQSCLNSFKNFVFDPNEANTWVGIQAMVENFLITLWREGALMGSSPRNAYSVRCGLGSTMTANDIINGKLIVEIGVALLRPAEFIIISISQQQMISH